MNRKPGPKPETISFKHKKSCHFEWKKMHIYECCRIEFLSFSHRIWLRVEYYSLEHNYNIARNSGGHYLSSLIIRLTEVQLARSKNSRQILLNTIHLNCVCVKHNNKIETPTLVDKESDLKPTEKLSLCL